MSGTIWQATVSRVGGDAAEMLNGGVLILFGEPVPEALAEVSIVHSGASELLRPPAAGDVIEFAGQSYVLDEVGGRAAENIIELGHLVLYVNQPGQDLLPGAAKASGPELALPRPGSVIAFRAG